MVACGVLVAFIRTGHGDLVLAGLAKPGLQVPPVKVTAWTIEPGHSTRQPDNKENTRQQHMRWGFVVVGVTRAFIWTVHGHLVQADLPGPQLPDLNPKPHFRKCIKV